MIPGAIHPRTLLVAWAAAALTAAGPVRSEPLAMPLEMPAYQMLDLDEGTIEFDIRPHADAWQLPSHRLGDGRARIVRFTTGDPAFPGDGIELALAAKPGWGTYIRVPFASGGRNVSHLLNIILRRPAEGAWLRVAVAWSREERLLQAYVDGRPAESRAFLTGLDLNGATGSGARLSVGPEGGPAQAPFELRALRISRVRRPGAVLADASVPLAADAQTLLLLHGSATGEPQQPERCGTAATPAARDALRPTLESDGAQKADLLGVKRAFPR